MTYHLPAWVARAFRRDDHGGRWSFEVDRFQSPVAWRWERLAHDGTLQRSSPVFPSFAACARDAAAHGFSPSQSYCLRDHDRAADSSDWTGPRRAPAEENAAHH